MGIVFTPTFDRSVKKLHRQQKQDLDIAVETIVSHPEQAETKVGDLAGVKVYKFRMVNMNCLLAHRVLDAQTIKLLMVGPHENFYRDLNRIED